MGWESAKQKKILQKIRNDKTKINVSIKLVCIVDTQIWNESIPSRWTDKFWKGRLLQTTFITWQWHWQMFDCKSFATRIHLLMLAVDWSHIVQDDIIGSSVPSVNTVVSLTTTLKNSIHICGAERVWGTSKSFPKLHRLPCTVSKMF